MPTQSNDFINTSGDGFDFSVAPETLTIAPGVVLGSTGNFFGVYSGLNNSTIVNFGQILSTNFEGIFFTGDNGTILNELGSAITSLDYGIYIAAGNQDKIDNLGSIVGVNSGVWLGGSAYARLSNHGSISGEFEGVLVSSTHPANSISNFGAIRSDQIGVEVNSFSTSITNGATGIIKGDFYAIETLNGGSLSLNNHGTIIGNIDCSIAGAHDVIINHGSIQGDVFLGSNDTFKGGGGRSGEIAAFAGNDRIIVGNGNVKIFVGTGNDVLTAGRGHDQFFFEYPSTGQVEKITNFNPALDKIALSETAFAGIGTIGVPLAAADFHIGTHAKTLSQHIIYNPNNGFLYYDPDGSGAMPQIHFATVSHHLALIHGDFLVET